MPGFQSFDVLGFHGCDKESGMKLFPITNRKSHTTSPQKSFPK
jgi:hypothetical protein